MGKALTVADFEALVASRVKPRRERPPVSWRSERELNRQRLAREAALRQWDSPKAEQRR